MLTADEQDRLALQLCATAEAMGREIKPATAALMVGDLIRYDYQPVCRALAQVRADQPGYLTLKAIIDRINDGSQHPGSNEAWAQCLPALSEANTVVWSHEMAQAWAIALPVLSAGDRVGARMAFIQAYERLVTAAKGEGTSPQWQISQGHDPDQRIDAIQKAVQVGQLRAPIAERFLPPPERKGSAAGKRRIAESVHCLAQAMAAERRRRDKERKARIEADRKRRLELFDEQYAELQRRQSKP